MNYYDTVKEEYERVRRGNARLNKIVDDLRKKADNDKTILALDKKIKELYKQIDAIATRRNNREKKILAPGEKALKRIRDYSDEFGHRNLDKVKQEYIKAKEQKRAAELGKKGVFTVEQARDFAKGEIDDVNPLWIDRPFNDKDGYFYKKLTLDNGVTVYHNKASDYESMYSTSYNTYFAFDKKGKFIGKWRKRRTYHAGDWSDVSVSHVKKNKQQGLTFYEWKLKLNEVGA